MGLYISKIDIERILGDEVGTEKLQKYQKNKVPKDFQFNTVKSFKLENIFKIIESQHSQGHH